MRGVLLIIPLVLFVSCKNEPCRESITPVKVELKVERLERSLFDANSKEEVVGFLKDHDEFAKYFLSSDQYPSDAILANKLFTLFQNPSIDTLFNEATKAFKNFDEFIKELEGGYGRLKAYYPETNVPILQTAVTGLAEGADLYISNDRVIIGIDFFVGEKATFKPLDIPNYILSRYTIDHLPGIILQFVSSQYVREGKNDAMLSDMITYGKNYYLLSRLLPCTEERLLIGYSEAQWSDVFENDKIIWANFIQNEWLYETNHTIKQKFMSERPTVYEIGDKCPGRIGAWVGWQIVNAYMKNTESTIQELLAETDHNKIFMQSGYKPGS
ncbi:MAG: gliding motility lipoprotein GldB [Bacteroidota bacterium]